MMNKKKIEICFRKKPGISLPPAEAPSSCGCQCGCDPSPKHTMEELVKELSEKNPELGEISLIDTTALHSEEIILRLNKIFRNSNENLIIKDSTFDFILPKVLPLIALDGKILSAGKLPNATELKNAIMSGKRIPLKSGCC